MRPSFGRPNVIPAIPLFYHLAVPEKVERGKEVTGQNKENIESVFTSGSLLLAAGGEELTNNECPG